MYETLFRENSNNLDDVTASTQLLWRNYKSRTWNL